MSDTELLIKEVRSLPADYVKEALELITALKQKRHEGSLSYLAKNGPRTIEDALSVSAERAAARRANPALNTFRKYHGCLKDSSDFDRDGMEIQRELRREWE
jgi:hypothetical protein